MKLLSLLILCAFTLSACSDDSKTTPKKPDPSEEQVIEKATDCSFLERDNCWKSAVRTLNCRDTNYFNGKLSSTLDSCLLGDGTLVRFQQPIFTNQISFRARVERLGRRCGTIQKTANKTQISTKKGTVSIEQADDHLKVSCENGETYSLPADVLQTCIRAHIPGIQTQTAAGDFTVLLTGTGSASAPLFRCLR